MPKKSTFTGITSVPSTYFFDVFGQGFNYRISKANLFQQMTDEIGASGVQSIDGLSGALQLIAGTNMSIVVNPVDGSFTFNSSLTPESIQSLSFDTTAGVAVSEGQMAWNDTDKTLDVGTSGGSAIQLGQEILIRVLNNTGSAFSDGDVVYITGAQGNRVTAALAQADSASGNSTIGVVTQPIANNQQGFITVLGLVRNFDTSAWSEGDELWLSASVAGEITNVMPSLPNSAISVGFVSRSNASNGSIFVRIIRGVTSVTGDANITIAGSPNNPQVTLDSSQTFTSYALSTTDSTGIAQGFSAGGNSVFTWSYDGADTSASMNFNSIPYFTATSAGARIANVDFAAFGGTHVPQPVLTSGSTSELISALGSTSGLSWVDDSTNGPFDGISGQLFCVSGAFDGAPLAGARLSFGANEAAADSGVIVPRNCQFVMATLMATGLDGTLTLALEIDQVAQSAAHDLSVTGTVTNESDIVDVASTPLAVSSGQQVNYEVTTAPTTAGAIDVVLWFMFD